eukprot:IDg15751t1
MKRLSPTPHQSSPVCTAMNSMLAIALCGLIALVSTTCATADPHLEAALDAHVRALDTGESDAKLLLPFTERQAAECTPSTRSVQPETCGRFECPFCESLLCKPSRIVKTGDSLFTITCERPPCRAKIGTAEKCCKRVFTISRECLPVNLPEIKLAGFSPGETLPSIQTAI